jgi:PilZ domain-containing protein
VPEPESRRRTSPRAAVCLPVTLTRTKGGAIPCRSVDVGLGGMCVTTERPLSVDEALSFELAFRDGEPITGRVRVLREQRHRVYALGFERLPAVSMHGIAQLVDDESERSAQPQLR